MSLEALERALIDNTYEDLFLVVDGKQATRSQLIEAFNEATKKGYTVLPPCDNVGADGRCAGHSDPIE
jgi:hypothetical protein